MVDSVNKGSPQRVEPYFTLVEEESHFKILCSTKDASSGSPMRNDKLVIEKKGCVIYTKGKCHFFEMSSIFYLRYSRAVEAVRCRSAP